VVVAGSRAPLRSTEIRIGSGGQGQTRATLTDDEGRFEFTSVVAGAYTATASKAGYLGDGEGFDGRPTSRALEVANGQAVERIDFELTKASAVTVRVLDPFGDPLPGAEVFLQRYRHENGERRLEAVPMPGRLRSTTDDRGEVRVFGLARGEYFIVSHMRDRLFASTSLTDHSYVSTYYPGVTSLDEAQTIVVGQGQELHVEITQVAETDTRAAAPTPKSAGNAGSAPAPPSGRIRGRVIAAETGAPIVRAQVQLALPGGPVRVMTDLQGRYELPNIPPGRFRLSAARAGYLQRSFGQQRMLDPGWWVELNAAQTLDDIDFRLPKAGVMTVRVTDETGEPVEGVSVSMLQPRFIGGVRQIMPVAASMPTDDRGEMRLFGLAAGEYYVSARMLLPVFGRRDDRRAHAPTYYPGTLSAAQAVPLFVAPGQEQAVAVPLMAARAATVSAIVRRSDGSPPHRPSVSLVQTAGLDMSGRGAIAQADGTFTIRTVFPGEYSMIVVDGDVEKPESKEFAVMRLTVAGDDISGLVVTTARGGAAHGRMKFDAGVPYDILPGAIRLSATLAPGASIAGAAAFGLGRPSDPAWEDDWTFSMEGLNARRVLRLDYANSHGWYLKAVMLDGKDVTDTPLDFDAGREVEGLEVILTRKRSGVSGDVQDNRGRVVRDFTVVLFPDDDRQWTPDSRFIASGRADQQGRFRIGGMPDGAYLIAAVDFLESGEERDPELLRQLRSRATRLTLGEGETRTISLRLQGR
jgi:protocatechuate 3,4-dioxygenase beta subunit